MIINKLSLWGCTILSFIFYASFAEEIDVPTQNVKTVNGENISAQNKVLHTDKVSPLQIEQKTQIDEKDKSLASESILEVLSENKSRSKLKRVENSQEREQLLIDKAKARQKKALEANKHPEKLDENMIRLRQEANVNYHRNEGNEKISIIKAKKEALENSKRSDNNENEKSLSASFSKISQGDDDKNKKKNAKKNTKKNTYQKKTDALINAFK